VQLCGRLREQLRPQLSSVGDIKLVTMFSQQWFFRFHNHKAFCLSDSSLLHSQDLLRHNMESIIYLGLSSYIRTVDLDADGT